MEQDRGGEAWSVWWSATACGSDQLSRLRSRGVRPSEQQISGPGHQVRGREYEHYGSGSGNSNYSVLLVIFDTRLCDIFNLLCVVKINFSTLKTTSNRFQIKPFIKMCWHQNYTPTNLCIHNLHLLFVYFRFKTHSSLCHYYTWWPNQNTFQFDHLPCLNLIQIWICTICIFTYLHRYKELSGVSENNCTVHKEANWVNVVGFHCPVAKVTLKFATFDLLCWFL